MMPPRLLIHPHYGCGVSEGVVRMLPVILVVWVDLGVQVGVGVVGGLETCGCLRAK